VVVGTCPDLGTVGAIPQPLRTIVHNWSIRLAKAQFAVTHTAGGSPVPMGDLGPEFLTAPDRLFADDGFHPSADGYALAATHLLPILVTALAQRRSESPQALIFSSDLQAVASEAAERRDITARLRGLIESPGWRLRRSADSVHIEVPVQN